MGLLKDMGLWPDKYSIGSTILEMVVIMKKCPVCLEYAVPLQFMVENSRLVSEGFS